MSSFIYTGGCKVLVENPSLTHAPDMCNCSGYYISEGLGSQPRRQICPDNQLWNYKLGGCEDEASVLAKRLCNRKLPWERCSDDTASATKAQIKRDCIRKGTYSEAVAAQYDDKLPFEAVIALPNDVVLGNMELAAAAFVAGCVITLVLVAMILTMCRLPGVGGSGSAHTKGSTTVKKVTKKKRRIKEVVTEGDNVSIQYEDIDEDMTGQIEQGYKPMFSGAHLQLHGTAFQESNEGFKNHHVTTSMTVSSSSNSQWTTKQQQGKQLPPTPVQPSRPIPALPTRAQGRQPPPPLPPGGNKQNPVPIKPLHTTKQQPVQLTAGNQPNRGKGPMRVPPRR